MHFVLAGDISEAQLELRTDAITSLSGIIHNSSKTSASVHTLTLKSDRQDTDLSYLLLGVIRHLTTRGDHPFSLLLFTEETQYFLDQNGTESGEFLESLSRMLRPGELLCDEECFERFNRGLLKEECEDEVEALLISYSWGDRQFPFQLISPSLFNLELLPSYQQEELAVGRESERSVILSRLSTLRQASSLQQPLIQIIAPAGFGKSSLLQSLIPEISHRGFLIARSLCTDFANIANEQTVPRLTRALITLLVPDLEEDESLARLQIEDALPDYVQLFALYDLLGFEALAEEQRALSHFAKKDFLNLRAEVVGTLIHRLTQRQPLCLVIEDLHWIDEYALHWLKYTLENRQAFSGLLILGTARPEGALSSHLPDHGDLIETVELHPLSVIEARELALKLTLERRLPWQLESGDYISSDWIERCILKAEGHPLYLTQLLKDSPQSQSSSKGKLGLSDLLILRFKKLSAGTQALLYKASCVGRTFSLNTLQGPTERVSQAALQEALNQQLITGVGEQYEFCHALIRDVIYQELDEEEKKQLHLELATTLQADLELYAEHLALARDERASQAFIHAAEVKIVAAQGASALSLLDRALQTVTQPAQRLDILSRQGWLYEQLGDGRRCLNCFNEALSIAELIEASRSPILLGGLAAHRLLGDLDQAELNIQHLNEFLKSSLFVTPLFHARFAYYRGCIAFSRGQLEECTQAHRLAIQKLEERGNLENHTEVMVYAQAWSGRGDADYARGHYISAGKAMRRALEIAYDHHLGRVEVSTLHMLAIVTTYLGDPTQGIHLAKRCYQSATRVNDVRSILFAELNMALPMLWAGQAREAVPYGRSALKRVEWMDSAVLSGMSSAFISFTLWFAGEKLEASSLAEEAYKLSQRAGKKLYGGVAIGALLLSATDQSDDLDEKLDEAVQLLSDNVVSHNYLYLVIGAGLYLLKTNQLGRLETVYREFERFFNLKPDQDSPEEDRSATGSVISLLYWMRSLINKQVDPRLSTNEQSQRANDLWNSQLAQLSDCGLKLFQQLEEQCAHAHSHQLGDLS